jgi:alkylhydroperoxidase family enzyme
VAYIERCPADDIRSDLRKAARYNILGIHTCNPPVLEAHVALYRAAAFGEGPLSRSMREMIAVAVSAINECHY